MVDSAPGQAVPVSQAKALEIVGISPDEEGNYVDAPSGFVEIPVFHQLGTEPGEEDDEWEPVKSKEQALGLEASDPHVAGEVPPDGQNDPTGRFSAPEAASKQVHVLGLPPFNPDDVDLPVVSPMLPEMIRTISETLRGFKWLYGKAKKKVRLLPEQQGELQRIYGDGEKLLEQLKAIK